MGLNSNLEKGITIYFNFLIVFHPVLVDVDRNPN